MDDGIIYVKKYPLGESGGVFGVNEKEVWRYSGYAGVPTGEDSTLNAVLAKAIEETLPLLTYRVCYRRIPLSWDNGIPRLPFSATSKKLARCLEGSTEAVIFAASIGIEIDRSIERSQRVSPAKALLIQALGAERIEALCDTFCRDIEASLKEDKVSVTPRFSPGYGDLPLEVQRDFFRLLDCSRKIGLTLNESLLMSPSKSVTAIFGLRREKDGYCGGGDENKCARCENSGCDFRINN